MKLDFAAPASGLPSLPIALGSHASREHFAMKLFNAAPASGLLFLPMAWLWHALSAIAAELRAKVIRKATKPIRFLLKTLRGYDPPMTEQYLGDRSSFLRQMAARDYGAPMEALSPPTPQYIGLPALPIGCSAAAPTCAK